MLESLSACLRGLWGSSVRQLIEHVKLGNTNGAPVNMKFSLVIRNLSFAMIAALIHSPATASDSDHNRVATFNELLYKWKLSLWVHNSTLTLILEEKDTIKNQLLFKKQDEELRKLTNFIDASIQNNDKPISREACKQSISDLTTLQKIAYVGYLPHNKSEQDIWNTADISDGQAVILFTKGLAPVLKGIDVK